MRPGTMAGNKNADPRAIVGGSGAGGWGVAAGYPYRSARERKPRQNRTREKKITPPTGFEPVSPA